MSPLGQFFEAACNLWEQYRSTGPNSLSTELLDALERAHARLRTVEDTIDRDVLASIETLLELSRQCTLRTEGLSFVTGEGGLIPRRDLHDRFDQALMVVNRSRAVSTD